MPPERLRVIQVQSASNGRSIEDGGKWATERVSVATREGDNGGEMHGRPHEHPVLGTSLLSILHNGLMINEVETVRQAEETELTLYCDSIGGSLACSHTRFVLLSLLHTPFCLAILSFIITCLLFKTYNWASLFPFTACQFIHFLLHKLILIFIIFIHSMFPGRPRSIVKWYRLIDWENKTDMSSEQLYSELQSKG